MVETSALRTVIFIAHCRLALLAQLSRTCPELLHTLHVEEFYLRGFQGSSSCEGGEEKSQNVESKNA